MEDVKWLLSNPRLIPAVICFGMGIFFAALSSILFQLRKKRLVLFTNYKMYAEYNNYEKRVLLIGIILLMVGMVSFAMC